jgi:glycosyltransferase involved in cell wall biosynthesis
MINKQKLNVLHIIPAPIAGGAEVFVKDMVINSLKHNISPSILFISSAGDVNRSEQYQTEFISELNHYNIPYCILPNGARRNLFKGLKTYLNFKNKINPSIVHAHLLSGVIYSKILSFKLPLVYTHHNSVISTNGWVFKACMRMTDQLIGISRVCATNLEKYSGNNKKAIVIYNSVDKNRITPKVDIHSKNKHLIEFLAVGSISVQKNYPLMLESFLLVKREHGVKFKLKIAGEGDPVLLEKLKLFVFENSLSENVEFLGNRNDIPQLMNKADLFVMSSAWEGLPISLLEAQCTGLPAIVTDVGGCKEVLDITNGGVIVEADNPQEFSGVLVSLIKNHGLRGELTRNSLAQADRFSIDYCISKHRKLYQSIILS